MGGFLTEKCNQTKPSTYDIAIAEPAEDAASQNQQSQTVGTWELGLGMLH